jgi:hypothetical protein
MSIKIMSLVFEARGMTSAEKLVALALADHAHDDGTEARPGQTRLTYKTELSEQTVRRAIKGLLQKNIIVIQRPATPIMPVCYRFALPGANLAPPTMVAAGGFHGGTQTINEPSKTTSMRTDKSATQPDKQFEPEFTALWRAYPRKSDKIGARKQVVARLKAGAPFEELLEATENYALRRSGQDQEKTMYGKTFWNNERWKDWLPGGSEDVIRTPSRTKITEIVDDTVAAFDEFFNSAASNREIRRTPIVVHLLGLFTLKKLGSMPARDLRLVVEGVAQQMQYPS